MKMKLNYDFVVTDMGDELVAVPVGENADQFHGMIRMNDSAAEVLELLKEELRIEELHRKLMERYPDSSMDEIGKFLETFINNLIREGVLSLIPD